MICDIFTALYTCIYGVVLTLSRFRVSIEYKEYKEDFTYRVIFVLGIGVLICPQPKVYQVCFNAKKYEEASRAWGFSRKYSYNGGLGHIKYFALLF